MRKMQKTNKDYYVLKVKKGKLTANINHKNPNFLYSDKGFFIGFRHFDLSEVYLKTAF